MLSIYLNIKSREEFSMNKSFSHSKGNGKAIFFDFDGMLVKEKSSWQIIHRHLGTDNQAKLNSDLFHKGEIDYCEWGSEMLYCGEDLK